MKKVQHPRGSEAQENNVIGAIGQIRVDTTNRALRLHDAVTPGGHVIPNTETIKQMIASGAEGAVGSIRIANNFTELAALSPDANSLVIVRGEGFEDAFLWHNGAGDAGTITSNFDGHWRRLDGPLGFFIRAWRAGLANIQFGGAEPESNQGSVIWIVDGEALIWDGADFEPATPTLYARYLGVVGNYAIGAVVMPGRLQDPLTEVSDLNDADESGFYKSAADADNAPIAGVNVVTTYMYSSTAGMQIVYVAGTQGDAFVRHMTGSAWGSWTLIPGQLPARLRSEQNTTADLNSATSSGFYTFATGASNKPSGFGAGVLLVMATSDTKRKQIAMDLESGKMAHRTYLPSAWGSWSGIFVTPGANSTVFVTDGAGGAGFDILDEAAYFGTNIINTPQLIDGAVTYVKLATSVFATESEFKAGTASKALALAPVWDSADLTALTYGGSIAVDFAAGFNFGGASNAPLALSGNAALAAPTNVNKNQTGVLWFTASGGARTLTLNAAYKLVESAEVGPYVIPSGDELGIVYTVRGTDVIVAAILRR
jgi:hypothetical protein